MKKIAVISVLALIAGGANAGILDSLGLTKKAEPQSLAEACDTDEIKKICPEILLGTMTMAECVKQNISELSTQCANYVKKSITNGGEELKNKLAEYQSDAQSESDAAAAERAAKTAEVKQAASDTIESAKKTGGLLKSLF